MKRFTHGRIWSAALALFLVGAGLWSRANVEAQSIETQRVDAQSAPILESLGISLWPEYDRPGVLVIYRGLFAADTPLPVPVEISIPARVGQPSAVAFVGDGGEPFNQQSTTRVEDDRLIVSFELDALGFQLEYYDTLPADSAGQRQYTYAYTADYPITALTLDFQVPPTAEGFALDPPADKVTTESDGLVYHVVNAGSLIQGEERSWTFAYQKDNADLTAPASTQPGTAATSSPGTPQRATGTGNSTVLIFLVAFVALVAVGTAAFWLGHRVQPVAHPTPPMALGGKPSTSQRQTRRGSGLRARAQALFCAQCGAEVRPDAGFCQRCGAPIRSSQN